MRGENAGSHDPTNVPRGTFAMNEPFQGQNTGSNPVGDASSPSNSLRTTPNDSARSRKLDPKNAGFDAGTSKTKARKVRHRLAEGVWADQWGIAVCVGAHGKQFERRLPPDTPLEVAIERRRALRAEVGGKKNRVSTIERFGLDRHPHRFGFKECCIYLIQDGDAVKIGKANDVQVRLADLQIANPRRLTLLVSVRANDYMERELHKRFAHLKIHGEWFQLSPEIEEIVAFIRNGGDIGELFQ